MGVAVSKPSIGRMRIYLLPTSKYMHDPERYKHFIFEVTQLHIAETHPRTLAQIIRRLKLPPHQLAKSSGKKALKYVFANY